MSQTTATNKQVPDHSILDHFGKQTYLGNGFILPVRDVTLANNTETVVALIKNPASTASPVLNKALFLSSLNIAAGGIVYVRYYLTPTITTNGTAATPVNLRPASPNTSSSLCFTGPTIAANGTLMGTFSSTSDVLIILDAGKTVLVTYQYPGAGTITVNTDHSWYEI